MDSKGGGAIEKFDEVMACIMHGGKYETTVRSDHYAHFWIEQKWLCCDQKGCPNCERKLNAEEELARR